MQTPQTNQTGSTLAALITQIETTGDLSLLPALRQRVTLPDLLTKQEAAAFLTIAIRTLDDWRTAKLLPCVTIGGIIRFRRADLESFLTAHTVQPRTTPAYRPRRKRTPQANNSPA